MTTLTKPLSRIVDIGGGQEVIVTIVPADAGIQAHVKLRLYGHHKSYQAIYLEPPTVKP